MLFAPYVVNASGDEQNINIDTVQIELTKDEKDLLDNLGELQIIVDDDYAPISFYSKETKSFGGISVNVIELLSEMIGFDYHIIRDETLSWSDRLDLIKNNKINILCGASINDERKEFGYFTDEYYFSSNYAMIGYIDNHITIRTIENIKDYHVGLVKGVTINNYILSYLNDEKVTYFSTMDEALVALKNRKIDLVPDNEATFIEAYFNAEKFDFEVVHSISDITKNYGYFLPKTKEGLALKNILSKGLKKINIDSVINNHYENKSIFSFYKNYVEELKQKENNRNAFLMILIGALIVVLGFYFFIQKKNNELKKSRGLLAETGRIGNVGGWEIDIDTGKKYWTEEVYSIHEVAPDYDPNVETDINFFTPESRPVIKKFIQQAAEQGKPFDTELEIVTAKGNLRSIHAIGRPDLNRRKVYGFFQDITSRKQAEARHCELEGELRQKHKMEAVGYMAGGMAHNFNNNLGIILGNVELSQLKVQDPNVQEMLVNAKTAILRSRDLVSQIITYSRKGIQTKTTIQLQTIIDETIILLSSTLPATINLQKVISPTCDSNFVNADASQVQEILVNLCNNAVQAMDEKGDLTISLESVELSQTEIPSQYDGIPGKYVKLSVQDSGCGMPTEMIDKIFDPFFTTKEEHEGVGMGLATVQGIVAQHGGVIRVNSIPNQGTVFNIYFPIADNPVAETKFKPAKGDMPKGTEKILFVDDDEILASLGKKLLKVMGYQVTMMTDSTEAIKLFTANADHFDMVITDQTMPDLSGKELISKIKAIRADIPTILCTGYSSKIDEEEAAELGIDAFMLKPLDLPILSQTIRQVLDGDNEK